MREEQERTGCAKKSECKTAVPGKTCAYKCSTNETSVLHATNKGSGTQPKTIPVSPERCAAAHSPRIHGKHGAKQMQRCRSKINQKFERQTVVSKTKTERSKIRKEKCLICQWVLAPNTG